jgi:hypothetical protein
VRRRAKADIIFKLLGYRKPKASDPLNPCEAKGYLKLTSYLNSRETELKLVTPQTPVRQRAKADIIRKLQRNRTGATNNPLNPCEEKG